jgi:hypothetical protein
MAFMTLLFFDRRDKDKMVRKKKRTSTEKA